VIRSNPRSFRLRAKTLEALQKIADKEQRSINWLIQVAADKLIELYKRKGVDALRD
jgi:hypothetical protein